MDFNKRPLNNDFAQPKPPQNPGPAEPNSGMQYEPAPEPPKVKKGGKKKKLLLWAVVLLLMLGLGGYGAWAYTENSRLNSELGKRQSDLDSANAQTAELSSENSKLEDQVAQGEPDPNGSGKSDKEMALAAAQAYENAKDNTIAERVTITKNSAQFATATSVAGTLTQKMVLKKSGDTWVVVWCDTTAPTAEVVKEFGIPAEYAK